MAFSLTFVRSYGSFSWWLCFYYGIQLGTLHIKLFIEMYRTIIALTRQQQKCNVFKVCYKKSGIPILVLHTSNTVTLGTILKVFALFLNEFHRTRLRKLDWRWCLIYKTWLLMVSVVVRLEAAIFSPMGNVLISSFSVILTGGTSNETLVNLGDSGINATILPLLTVLLFFWNTRFPERPWPDNLRCITVLCR